MPIYEYRCAACGHTLEALQKMTDGPLKKCPECGKSQLRRLVSAPVFRLKGSGWSETDFKSESEKKRNLVEAGASESSAEAGSGDAKDAAKDTAAESAPPKGDKPAKVSPPVSKGAKSAAKAASRAKPAAKPAAARKAASKPRAARTARR